MKRRSRKEVPKNEDSELYEPSLEVAQDQDFEEDYEPKRVRTTTKATKKPQKSQKPKRSRSMKDDVNKQMIQEQMKVQVEDLIVYLFRKLKDRSGEFITKDSLLRTSANLEIAEIGEEEVHEMVSVFCGDAEEIPFDEFRRIFLECKINVNAFLNKDN